MDVVNIVILVVCLVFLEAVVGVFVWGGLLVYGSRFSPPPSPWLIVWWPFALLLGLVLLPVDAYREHRAKQRKR